MKKIIFLSLVVMTACTSYTFSPKYVYTPQKNLDDALYQFVPSETIGKENEQSIRNYVKIGVTNSKDIIAKYKRPSTKILYNDGKFAYIYYFDNKLMPNNKDTIHEKRMGFSKIGIVEETTVICSFIFNTNNILDKFEFVNNSLGSEDRYTDISSTQDSSKGLPNNADKPNPEQYLDAICSGIQKGTIFRTIGKPNFSEKIGGKEYWYYNLSDLYVDFIRSKTLTSAEIEFLQNYSKNLSMGSPLHGSLKREVHFDNKYFFATASPGTKIYYLEFTQDKLSVKGFFTIVALTEEENKEFLKEQRKLQ